MIDGAGFDDRYVGFREHAAAQQRMDAELARLRERQATTEATLLHEMTAVRGDVSEMKQLLLRPSAGQSEISLAMHNAADAFRAATQKGGSAVNPLLLALSLIGALAIGIVGAKLLGIS